MNDPYSHAIYPRCQEINRQVKLAEWHQQTYYRDELHQPAKTGSPDWVKAWKRILTRMVREPHTSHLQRPIGLLSG